MKKLLTVLTGCLLFALAACTAGNTPAATDATSPTTAPPQTTVESSPPQTTTKFASGDWLTPGGGTVDPTEGAVALSVDGAEVTVAPLSLTDYTVGAFVRTDADAGLTADAPTIAVDARCFPERDWLRYRFSGGRAALAERYFLFADGELIAEGDSAVCPTETGEYLLYIDFLFCEDAAVSAERVAVRLQCTRGARYDAEQAQGYPSDPHQLIFCSEVPAEVVVERLAGKHAFTAQTDDPAEALQTYFTAQLESKRQSTDAAEKIDDYRFLAVRVNGVHLLKSYRSYAVYFQYAVKPASTKYLYSQTLAPVWGEGELAGWAIYDGTVDLKNCGDGTWLWLDSALPGERTALPFGFVWCGDELLAPKFEPSLFYLPENWRESALDGDHTVLRELLYMDWAVLEAALGSEGVDYFMARLRANAFSTLTNRDVTHNSDIFTAPRDLPQTLRTLFVMYGAQGIPDAVRADYAALLCDLRAIDPSGFADCLTQIPKELRQTIQTLLAQ